MNRPMLIFGEQGGRYNDDIYIRQKITMEFAIILLKIQKKLNRNG